MAGTTACQSTTMAPPWGAAISAESLARHEGLVRWVVRRQYLGDLAFADALQEGRLGLWRALAGYDPSRGTAFSSYAVPAIARAVWSAVASSHALAEPQSPAPRPTEPRDPDESLYRAEVSIQLRALVAQLPPRLRLVIVTHYGLDDTEPQSYAALGCTLHVTRQRVQQLHVQALLWLAHPAHSLSLRRLLECHSRADYQGVLARHYRVARARRYGGRASR